MIPITHGMRILTSILSLSAIFTSTAAWPSQDKNVTCWRDTYCTGPVNATFEGPWTANIFAPPSRTVWPRTVLNEVGNLTGSYYPFRTILTGNSSRVTFDFGIEIGGVLTLDYNVRGSANIGMAFSESKTFIGEYSDSSTVIGNRTDGFLIDDALNGTYWARYTMPDALLRGGFRYLTVFLANATNETTARIYNAQIEMSIQPHWSNLRAYQGYFHSSDEKLNKIWYSGAYTLQMNSIPPKTGRPSPHMEHGWSNSATVGYGNSLLVDGAKRGRRVGPGYMGTAISAAAVSTGDLEGVKNTLQTMYYFQAKNGSFSRYGPPSPRFDSDSQSALKTLRFKLT
jgi:hypothetical protein